MTDPSGSDGATLYDALAEPAPPGTGGGQTMFTATKETMDNDREEAETTTLIGER